MRKLKILTLILAVAFLASCAGQNIKTPDQMTSKERATFVLGLYNNAYSNYNIQFAATKRPFNKEMAGYFQGYKSVMESAWPVISTYAAVAQSGGTPTVEQEQMIIALIYQFQTILMKEASK